MHHKKEEDRIRHCYVETVTLESDDFVNMIILDASFILELFLRKNEKIDVLLEEWLLNKVRYELLLLENQLPFFVIKELYQLASPYLSNKNPLIQLTFDFFKSLNIQNKCPDVEIHVKHFIDLLRFFQLPPTNKLPKRDEEVIFPKYSITQLHEAGVKFKVASTKCVLDELALSIRDEKPSSKCVALDKLASTKCLLDEVASSVRDEDASRRILDLSFKNGVLEIPLLLFDNNTEVLVRNIIALEQCDYIWDIYVTDFYSILDNLIKIGKDVELLINKGILVNKLGENNAVTSMISNLNREIICFNKNSEFYQLSEDLNRHYEKSWHRWKVILRQQYLTMAIFLLVLTLIQTVLSILQVVL